MLLHKEKKILQYKHSCLHTSQEKCFHPTPYIFKILLFVTKIRSIHFLWKFLRGEERVAALKKHYKK